MRTRDQLQAAYDQFLAIDDDELTPSQLAVLDAFTWVLDERLPDTYVTDYLPLDDGDDATSPTPEPVLDPPTESGH